MLVQPRQQNTQDCLRNHVLNHIAWHGLIIHRVAWAPSVMVTTRIEDSIYCDVVPMTVTHMLFGHPWLFDCVMYFIVERKRKILFTLFGKTTISSQPVGQTGLVNRSLGNLLRCLIEDRLTTWNQVLPMAEFEYNA